MFDYSEARGFLEGRPFPHVVLHDRWDAWAISEAKKEYLAFNDWDGEKNMKWSVKKRFCGTAEKFPEHVAKIIQEASCDKFVSWLEGVTGIRGLMADPYLDGGGMHSIIEGGFLKVHVDFNWHERLQAWRRLNVLLYLNPDWKEEHGGDLQMWDINGCHKRVYPEANTMVVMTTDDRSLHGHPDPLGGGQRDSIALYYYTKAQPIKHCAGKRIRTNYL